MGRSVGQVGTLAAQLFVGGRIGVEGGLELRLEITAGNPTQDLPSLRRQAWVTGPAPAAAFLEQLVTDTHATSLPQGYDLASNTWTSTFFLSCPAAAVQGLDTGHVEARRRADLGS